MTIISANYFDGTTSAQFEISLEIGSQDDITLRGENIDERTYAFNDLEFSPRIGHTPRSIYLPDGAKCETLANDEIDAILHRHQRGLAHRIVHHLESRLPYVLIATLLSAVFVWGFSNFGVPFIAKQVAFAIPESADETLGQYTMDILDKIFFAETELDQAVQNRLRNRFKILTSKIDDNHNYRLLFRNSEAVGANAFALPSGIIVVTDGMVGLAKNDEQLVSVFAHEIGHVKYRHGLRTVLQGSAIVLIVTWVTGDLSSTSALSAALPVKLIEAKYSRTFETEADEFAREFLTDLKIPLYHFAEILKALAEQNSPDDEFTFLSSHPTMKQRIERLNTTEFE